MEIKFVPHNYALAEIFQTNQTEFAFRNNLNQVTEFVHCRDFLGDAIYATRNKTNFSIYGFNFDSKTQTLNQKETQLLIRFPNNKYKELFVTNLSILHKVEKSLRFKRTTVESTQEDLILAVSGSKMWQSWEGAISMYTFLLKCLTCSIIDFDDIMKLDDNEFNYRNKTGIKFWKFLYGFRKLLNKVKALNYEVVEQNTSAIHNYSGFVSVCTLFDANKLCPLLQEL